MKKEIEIITLEDGVDYAIVKIIESSNKFVYLANVSDPSDLVIRKLIIVNDEEVLAGLDSDEEFDEALALYNQDTN